MQESYKQRVIDFFNNRTAYDSEGKGHPEEAKRLLNFVLVQSGQTILDIATGTGLVAIPVAKAVAPQGSVIGVDMSAEMLAQANVKIVAEGINNLELIEADVESIDFNNEQFNLIFCCSALVYISDIPAILDKCYRWLKPGGCFAFTTPDKSSHLAEIRVKICQNLLGIDLPHIIRPLWTPEKCTTLLQKSGFQNIEIEKHIFRIENISDNYGSTQIEKEFYPRGNPLLNLLETQKQLLQARIYKSCQAIDVRVRNMARGYSMYIRALK